MTGPAGPLVDADTYDVIDNALLDLATRRSAWLGDELVAIGLLTSLIDQAQRFLPQHVITARENGHTWPELAAQLNTNPDEARLRFDPDSPIADSRWPHDTP